MKRIVVASFVVLASLSLDFGSAGAAPRPAPGGDCTAIENDPPAALACLLKLANDDAARDLREYADKVKYFNKQKELVRPPQEPCRRCH